MKKLLLIMMFLPSLASAQIIVIAHPGMKSAEISKGEIRNVFTGESTRLSDGTRVTPVLLKQCGTHDEFLSAYIGKSEAAFRAYWRSQVFSANSTC